MLLKPLDQPTETRDTGIFQFMLAHQSLTKAIKESRGYLDPKDIFELKTTLNTYAKNIIQNSKIDFSILDYSMKQFLNVNVEDAIIYANTALEGAFDVNLKNKSLNTIKKISEANPDCIKEDYFPNARFTAKIYCMLLEGVIISIINHSKGKVSFEKPGISFLEKEYTVGTNVSKLIGMFVIYKSRQTHKTRVILVTSATEIPSNEVKVNAGDEQILPLPLDKVDPPRPSNAGDVPLLDTVDHRLSNAGDERLLPLPLDKVDPRPSNAGDERLPLLDKVDPRLDLETPPVRLTFEKSNTIKPLARCIKVDPTTVCPVCPTVSLPEHPGLPRTQGCATPVFCG